MDHWRLLLSPAARGAWNMAVDEAILEAAGGRAAPPTLRLYAWNPACLSLGYAQPIADVDLERLAARGWDLVRRPTGGRAILHTDELTYSVAAPPDEPRMAGSLLESYNRLAGALLRALEILSLPVEIQEHAAHPAVQNTNPVCFEVPSTYEITVGGRKLVGSAQARRREGVLQHGSLPLTGDLTRIVQALAFPGDDARDEAARRLLERATTVEAALGRAISWDEAAQAFVNAFGEVLSMELQAGQLTSNERQRAEELVTEKYAHPDWTGRARKV
ncbi:MAG: lipoate--protein ligase family protein [Anaerolineales bacterium]|nr:lipoate--protein ligase family protein [Anaerolineales bacterium]